MNTVEPKSKQADVDAGVKVARQSWDEMLAESNMTQTLFIATSKKATQFLAEYEIVRKAVIKKGLTMPTLIEGVSVSFPDDKSQ